MASYAVKLPLAQDSSTGFAMISRIRELIKQNLKMLILTNPGERIMEPAYGVGIRTFLFENFEESVFEDIDQKIRKQISRYMPAVQVVELRFSSLGQDTNTLGLFLEYSIPEIATTDLLEITI